MSYEDVAMEDAIFPWLASDCMADERESLVSDTEEESDVDTCECGNPLESGDKEYCQECVNDSEFWEAW